MHFEELFRHYSPGWQSHTSIKEAAAARAASLPVSNDFASCWAEQRTGARTDRADLCEICARKAGRTEEVCEQVASIVAKGVSEQVCKNYFTSRLSTIVIVSYPGMTTAS